MFVQFYLTVPGVLQLGSFQIVWSTPLQNSRSPYALYKIDWNPERETSCLRQHSMFVTYLGLAPRPPDQFLSPAGNEERGA